MGELKKKKYPLVSMILPNFNNSEVIDTFFRYLKKIQHILIMNL
jgi:hypothetical protein